MVWVKTKNTVFMGVKTTSRILEQFYWNFCQTLRFLICFAISFVSILPLGRPTEAPRASKTNYMLNYSSFSTTISILDPKISMDMVHQNIKFCFKNFFILIQKRMTCILFDINFHCLTCNNISQPFYASHNYYEQ